MSEDLGSAEGIKQSKKRQRLSRNQRYAILEGIMSQVEGRRWIYGLLAQCHIFQTSFSSEALITAFREGERNIGLSLQADILAACPSQFLVMLEEQNPNGRPSDDDRDPTPDLDGGDAG